MIKGTALQSFSSDPEGHVKAGDKIEVTDARAETLEALGNFKPDPPEAEKPPEKSPESKPPRRRGKVSSE